MMHLLDRLDVCRMCCYVKKNVATDKKLLNVITFESRCNKNTDSVSNSLMSTIPHFDLEELVICHISIIFVHLLEWILATSEIKKDETTKIKRIYANG